MPRYGNSSERRRSLEEFQQLHDDDGYRTELSRGMLVREPPPGGRHGWLCADLFRTLDRFVTENKLGKVLIETGFRLAMDPPTVRGPDIAFIAAQRIPQGIPAGFWELAPDLAVEVVSPSDRWSQVQDKVFDYLDAGTRLVWVVEPAKKRVIVYGARGEVSVLGESDVVDGGDVLPGFSVRAGDLIGA
jgi:Uma2 family endonuclease